MEPSTILTLAIEASNPNLPTPGVLLAREGLGVLARAELRQEGRHDDVLMPAIAGLLSRAALKPTDIDEVLVSIGPGGFTATRLACVSAAVLGELAGACVLAVPTARVALASSFVEGSSPGRAVVAMAAKGPEAYVARFDAGMDGPWTELGSIDADLFARNLLPGDVLVHEGHLPELFLEIAARNKIKCIPMCLTAEGLLACRRVALAVRAEGLRPIYPREPDAVTQWRRRYGRAPGDTL